MKLYYSPTSPFVRKVNVMAHELGVDSQVERIMTNPWVRNDDLLHNNPLSKVPTLIADDGLVLYDSPVICEYLDVLRGGGLIPPAGKARWQALKVQAMADGILDAAVLRFLERKREESLRSSEWEGTQKDAVDRALDVLEQLALSWGTEVTIAQIASGVALGYLDFRFSEEDWRQGHPQLASWYGRFSMRPSMIATVPKTA